MKLSVLASLVATLYLVAALPSHGRKDAVTARTTTTSPDLSKLPAFKDKPRIFILSDILNEPDDSESLVRYLLYSNEFDTKGFCATTSTWLRNATHPEAMRKTITAYGGVIQNLNQHVNPNARYPSSKYLLSLVTTGPNIYGKAALSQPPSEGALKLVKALEESSQPLWVTAWGGVNTLAQSLDYIARTKSRSDAAALRSRLRVYTISDQDDTAEYIRGTYPDVMYIASIHAWNQYDLSTWRGISSTDIQGADNEKVTAPWLKTHIQLGPLGAQYPTPVYIMEGDTPSFLYLIQNGLGSRELPHYGSWGGRYGAINLGSPHYANTIDVLTGNDGVSQNSASGTVWRWRDHFQNDFAARIGWSMTSDFSKASHPPIPSVNDSYGIEHLNITVTSNQTLVFDASKSYDPDSPSSNSGLQYQWYQYKEPSGNNPGGPLPNMLLKLKSLSPPAGSNGTLNVNDAGFTGVVLGPKVQVTVPSSPVTNGATTPAPATIHLILQVTSSHNSTLPLRRYKRVLLTYPIKA